VLAAAVVPHPPILVPAIAAGTAGAAAPVLAACDDAVSALLGEAPEVVVCVGPGRTTTRHRPGAWGTLSGFGTNVPAPGHHHVGRAHLPLSLTIGRWLLDRAGWEGQVIAQELASAATPEQCRQVATRLRGELTGRACWLVLGDGSSMRNLRSPHLHKDDRDAAAYDQSIAALLAAADLPGLAALDPADSDAVQAGGRPAWQVLAAAVDDHCSVVRSTVRFSGAPFGVGYVVANWWLSGPSPT
jgi:hypothetical protein